MVGHLLEVFFGLNGFCPHLNISKFCLLWSYILFQWIQKELAEHVESLVDDLGIEEPQRTRVVAGAQAAGVPFGPRSFHQHQHGNPNKQKQIDIYIYTNICFFPNVSLDSKQLTIIFSRFLLEWKFSGEKTYRIDWIEQVR